MTRQEETKIIKQSNLIDYLSRHGHKKLWQSEDGKQASFKTPWQNSPGIPETFLSVFKGRNDNFWHYTERYGNERHQVIGDTGTIIDLYCKLHGVVFGDAMQALRKELINNPSRNQATDAMAKPLSTQPEQGAREIKVAVVTRNGNVTASRIQTNTNQAETVTMEKPNSMPNGSSRLDPVATISNRDQGELWMEKTNHADEIINYKKTLTVFSSQAEAKRWQQEYEKTATVMVAVDNTNYPELVNLLEGVHAVHLVITGQDSTAMTNKIHTLLEDIINVEDMRDYYNRFTSKIDSNMVDKIQNMTGADYDDIYEISKKINQHDKTPKQIDEELTNKVRKFLAKEQEQEVKKFVKMEEPTTVRTARIFNRIR